MTSDESDGGYGACGVGRCERIDVDIDGALDESHYEVEIASPEASLRMRMPTLHLAESLYRFLATHIGTEGSRELDLELLDSTTVTVVKDREFVDRFFVHVRTSSVSVGLTFAGVDASSLKTALGEALLDADPDRDLDA